MKYEIAVVFWGSLAVVGLMLGVPYLAIRFEELVAKIRSRTFRFGPLSGLLAPRYGVCLRCGTSWRFIEEHVTRLSEARGIFCLCEVCWSELTPEQRLPYYERLWRKGWWTGSKESLEEWEAIKKVVLAGK